MPSDKQKRVAILRILRLPEVERRVGLSGEQIAILERAKQFPGRVSPSPRTVGWIEHEIDFWIRQRIAERDDAVRAAQLRIERAPPAIRHRLRTESQRQREEAETLTALQATELIARERAGDVWADAPTALAPA
jgi:prophage regulatory protein